MTRISFNDYPGSSTKDLISKILLTAEAIRSGEKIYNSDGWAKLKLNNFGWSGDIRFSSHLDQFIFDDKDGIPNQIFSDFLFGKDGGSFTYGVKDIRMSFYTLKAASTTDQIIKLFFSKSDDINGGDSADVIRGYGGNDYIDGYKGDDRLYGDAGNDSIGGWEGNDFLSGGSGDDWLEGGSGKDILKGGSGKDWLDGGSGNDLLEGSTGRDRLMGDKGKDILWGGLGADELEGGSGADTFVFRSVKESPATTSGRDSIGDFSRKAGDKIDLKAIDANTKAGGNQAFKFIGTEKFHKKAGELRYDKGEYETLVYGDVNGDGKADFSIAVYPGLSMIKADFIL